jgi:hypothetical protein
MSAIHPGVPVDHLVVELPPLQLIVVDAPNAMLLDPSVRRATPKGKNPSPFPLTDVAVIVQVPVATAVTTPAETVATPVLSEAHVNVSPESIFKFSLTEYADKVMLPLVVVMWL